VAFVSCAIGSLASGSTGRAQPANPPPSPDPSARPQTPAVAAAELGALASRMAEQARRLSEVIAAELGGNDRGRRLERESTELAQAVGEFRRAVRDGVDRFTLRQAYAGVDATWHQLAAELSRRGTTTPALTRAVGDVAETDARIHAALGMNPAPAGYYGAQAPTGVADVQRLAHALVDRAERLAAVVRTDMTGPGAGRAVQDAVNLAALADTFHDSLRLEGRVDAVIANGYSGVAGQADRLAGDLVKTPPPRVQAAWQAFRSVDVLLRQALGMRLDPSLLAGTALAPGDPLPLVVLAGQLVEQVSAFLQVFGPTARNVPEGDLFLADAQVLQEAATAFRQKALSGMSPAQLAFEFRPADAVWQRLARRTARIARGRTGPNIQQLDQIGQTVAEIHRLLGVPGYPPVIAPAP
jgi:hypothetical protein